MNISDLIIDEEFESVIPPLTDEEFELLKESVLNDGEVYHPLVIWNNIIVDGHHRYKILKEHPEIKYRINKREFENRYEAIAIQAVTKHGILNVSKRLPMKSSPFVTKRQPPKQSLKKAQRLIPRLSGFAIGLTATIQPFRNTTIW